MAFVEVFEPDSATPMKPSIGQTMMKARAHAREALGERGCHAGIIEHVGQSKDEDTDQTGTPHLMERLAEYFADLRGLQLAHRQQQRRNDQPRSQDGAAADVGRESEHRADIVLGRAADNRSRRAGHRFGGEPGDFRQRRPRAGPGRDHDQQHGKRHPGLRHFAELQSVSLRLLRHGGIDRHAAVTEDGFRLPEFEQYQQARRSKRWSR